MTGDRCEHHCIASHPVLRLATVYNVRLTGPEIWAFRAFNLVSNFGTLIYSKPRVTPSDGIEVPAAGSRLIWTYSSVEKFRRRKGGAKNRHLGRATLDARSAAVPPTEKSFHTLGYARSLGGGLLGPDRAPFLDLNFRSKARYRPSSSSSPKSSTA